MILFCVTECLGSFKVAAKNCSRLSKIAGKRYLLMAGKRYLLQANAFFAGT
jgi:hypothetical protein